MRVFLPVLWLLVAILSVSLGAALAKSLFAALGPMGTTAARVSVAAILMVVLLRGWRARITRGNWMPLVIYGAALGGMNLFYFIALTTLPLGITSAIEFLGPLSVAVWFSRSRMDYVWSALAALGLLLLMPFGDGADALDPVGMLWALASAACWALYIIYGRHAGQQHGTQAVALGMAISALIALPFGIAEAGTALLDIGILPMVLLLALLTSAIPITLEMMALQQLPPRSFGVLLSVEPAIGTMIGFGILSETLTGAQTMAVGLVVIACAGAAWSARPLPPAAPAR